MHDELSKFAQEILEQRYLLRGKDHRLLENPNQMYWRVARAIAEAERKWGNQSVVNSFAWKFYDLMKENYFLPNSPALMNAGTSSQQLSACFVLPVEDSMEGIFDSLKRAALIHQKGGGTGFNFSAIRPKGDQAGGKVEVAFGPIEVISLFNHATEKIKQSGKRRGANMGILNVDHPDIFSFVSLKSSGEKLPNFNLSVGVTHAFMEAVQKDEPWDLLNPRNHQKVQSVPARHLWKEIVLNAWKCGDPGLVFLDTINQSNPVSLAGKIFSTNPCGEVPLLPNESCNLGSINVSNLYNSENMDLDWKKLKKIVKLSIRFLDNVIEVNHYGDDEVMVATLANRKIGLGIMGWADLLIKMRIPYASPEAVQLGEKLMEFIFQESKKASSKLGLKRGCFPNWSLSSYFPKEPMRNATLISIAPTGTISILAQTSPSIEPLFALSFRRKNLGEGDPIPVVNPLFLEYLKEQNLYLPKIINHIATTGSCASLKELNQSTKELFKNALEIDPEWHIRHQMAFQKFTDNAVSKTINLPENSTVDQVESIFLQAWKSKLKGITVFRNQPGKDQVWQKGLNKDGINCQVCIPSVSD
jgi:ribonucleoside-diphosphate reductase alpha chain